MRICLFNWKDTRHPAAGGAEVFTWEVLARWARAGHDVTWFTSSFPGGAESEETPDGVRIVRRGSRWTVFAEARRWYEHEARAVHGSFDLVVDEVNTRPFGTPAWVRDAPVVALAHQVAKDVWSAEFPAPVAALGRWVLEPWWLRRYRDTPTLTVSESSRASLGEYGLRKVTVVPEGIERRPRVECDRETAPTIIVLGRLSRSKRVEDAIEAFRRMQSAMPSARMWIVGDGPESTRLKRLAPPEVTFFGRVGDATRNELLARSHALVMTSVREGWGLVVDEAAAIGTPTIAYRRPGLCDSVPAARGVLVDPTPQALAQGLKRHLPLWHAEPAVQGWAGGARDWGEVAGAVMDACTQTVRDLVPVSSAALPEQFRTPSENLEVV
ncbi:glycosyltransferase family 4 protein [Catenulispora yoronensis]|uniref:Glycosyltransferase family 4 protein n=1 Tax=Catenulispora yoronensis TaxID=450799 RepID=A0ABN2V593_9ACTN